MEEMTQNSIEELGLSATGPSLAKRHVRKFFLLFSYLDVLGKMFYRQRYVLVIFIKMLYLLENNNMHIPRLLRLWISLAGGAYGSVTCHLVGRRLWNSSNMS